MKKKINKNTPILDLYYQWCKDQELPYEGLCLSFRTHRHHVEFRAIFEPQYFSEDGRQLRLEGKSTVYWGSDSGEYHLFKLTPLRQNLLLLFAAIKGEL